jgi:hypothetical protein
MPVTAGIGAQRAGLKNQSHEISDDSSDYRNYHTTDKDQQSAQDIRDASQ